MEGLVALHGYSDGLVITEFLVPLFNLFLSPVVLAVRSVELCNAAG